MAERRPRKRKADFDAADELKIDLKDSGRRKKIRSRRRKGRKVTGCLAFFLVFALIFAAAAAFMYKKYSPSNEMKDLNEWFEVEGDEVKVHLNDSRVEEITATAANGTVYLPVEWVHENLNKRFYMNEEERLLTYTLPDEVRDMTEESTDSEGKPVFIVTDKGAEIGINTIKEYTDIRAVVCAQETESAKRIFIYNENTVKRAEIKKDTALRTKGGIKAPVLTELYKGEYVTVIEDLGKWAKVSSEKGFVGYVRTKRLGETEDYTCDTGFTEPVFKQNALDEKVVLAWHLITGKAANATFDEYYENTKGLNVICPTWIQFKDGEGNYENHTSEEYIEKAHEAGLQVWVMVDNFNDPEGKTAFKTKEVFGDTEKRRRVIENLINDAKTYGYDGFNLDFESLPTEAGEHYVQFFRELSVACRREGIILSIDNYVPFHYNDHYERGEQADFADYVVIMGYDEHNSASEEAGSVASIDYVRTGIEETLKEVPKEKIINAVPFYTRVWKESGPNLSSSAMGMEAAKQYVEEEGIELTWDEEAGQYYGIKETETETIEIWQEEARSIALKADVIEEYGLAGVGAWRLGFEPAEIWDELQLND